MPNWCQNSLLIVGKRERIIEFFKACEGDTPRYFATDKWIEGEDRKVEVVPFNDYEPAVHKKFTFNALHPVPQEILDIGYSAPSTGRLDDLMKGKASDGYTWQSTNWGTKWDVDWNDLVNGACTTGKNYTHSSDDIEDFIEDINEGYAQVQFDFDTAWSPCSGWVNHVAGLYPDLDFRLLYQETGMEFAGILEYEDGKLLRDECYDKSEDLEGYKGIIIDEFGYEEEEFFGDEEEDGVPDPVPVS